VLRLGWRRGGCRAIVHVLGLIEDERWRVVETRSGDLGQVLKGGRHIAAVEVVATVAVGSRDGCHVEYVGVPRV
jgi:hypothetical protein